MGSLFWKERQKKAEGSRGRGTTGNSQSPLPHIDWRQRRPLEYLLIFRFLFFFFLIALLGGALPFHLLALSVLCLLIYFAIYLVNNFFYLWARQGGRERQRDREKEKEKEEGDFFYPLYSLFSPFIHSPFPLHCCHFQPFLSLCSPRSLLPSPAPSSSSPPLHSLSTLTLATFLTPPVF